MPDALPSGDQIEIRAGDRLVVVTEVGAGLLERLGAQTVASTSA